MIELMEDREVFSFEELIPVLLEKPSNVIYVEVKGKLSGIITMGRISRNWMWGGGEIVSPNRNFTSVLPKAYWQAKQTFSKNTKKRNSDVVFLPVVDSSSRLLGEYRKPDDDIILQHIDFFSNLPDLEESFVLLNRSQTVFVRPSTASRTKQELFLRCKELLEQKGVIFNVIDARETIQYFNKNCNIITVDWVQQTGLEAICKYMIGEQGPAKPQFIHFVELVYNLYGNAEAILKAFQKKNVYLLSIDIKENERGYLREFEEKIQEKYKQHNIEPCGGVLPEFRTEFLDELAAQYTDAKFPMELPGVCLQNGSWVLRDVNTPLLHISEGKRHTVEQPENYEHCIYMCGPCLVLGVYVEDQYTIPSLLQKKLNQAGLPYKVINLGIPGSSGKLLPVVSRLLGERIAEGDVIVFDTQGLSVDEIPELNLTNVLEEKRIPISWVIDAPRHCNHKVNQAYMEAIYQELLPALKQSSPSGKCLENDKDFIKQLYVNRYFSNFDPSLYGTIGSIVMNCNPFTFGHRYLIETALREVDFLIIFVVEEDLSLFSFPERFSMVHKGTADLANVMVVPSGQFILSRRTFPEYFRKETDAEIIENTESDIRLFAKEIAPRLGITHRFVGEELEDEVTNTYNQAMKRILPAYDIQLVEIPRRRNGAEVISASRVRKCIEQGNLEELENLIPETTRQTLFYEDA